MLKLENVLYDDQIPNWRRPRLKSMRYVIIFVVQGSFQFQLDDFETVMSKGDILFVRPGPYRSGTNGPFPPHQKYVAHFRLEADSLPFASPYGEANGYELFKTTRAAYFRQRFHALRQAWIDPGAGSRFVCHGLISEIFGSVLQELSRHSIGSHKLQLAKKMEAHLLNHFKEDVRLEDLCELVGLSPNYVIRIFKEVFRQTPLQFLHQLRVAVARDLLLDTNMAIYEISDYLGYCDPTYFNRVFKNVTGQPPSALRKTKSLESTSRTPE